MCLQTTWTDFKCKISLRAKSSISFFDYSFFTFFCSDYSSSKKRSSIDKEKYATDKKKIYLNDYLLFQWDFDD